MKNALTLFSLASAASAAGIEVAQTAGLALPAFVNPTNALLVFAIGVFALIVLADYGAKVRPIPLPRTVRRPASLARMSLAAAHHRVHALRRGAEAARLGAPDRIVIFARRAPVTAAGSCAPRS